VQATSFIRPIPFNRKLSTFLAYAFHPLLMPVYATLLVFYYNIYLVYSIPAVVQRIILLLIVVSTLLFPLATAIMLLQKGTISSLHMPLRKERNIPYLTTAIYYFTGWYLLSRLPVGLIFSKIMLAASIAIILVFFINLFFKISIHMIGIGGLTGILVALSSHLIISITVPILITVFIAGLLGTARIVHGKHSPLEVYTGFLLGFFCEWIFMS